MAELAARDRHREARVRAGDAEATLIFVEPDLFTPADVERTDEHADDRTTL